MRLLDERGTKRSFKVERPSISEIRGEPMEMSL
jgi:hypothetical protein